MHVETQKSSIHGVMAEFADEFELLAAARQARKAGFKRMDAYSPFPIHGLNEEVGFPKTRVPLICLLGGLTGLLSGYGLQYYISVIAYPINVAGRPAHSIAAFIPAAYECTILFASFAAGLGMLILNGLPQPYHPVFNVDRFRKHASSDGFFLVIESDDPKFETGQVMQFLKGLNARGVYEVQP